GDRAAAISTYHRCVAILDKELGVSPDAATVALYGRLVVADASRSRPSPHERRAADEPHLVGREAELAAIMRWRQSVGPSAPPLYLLHGEAGMGKSRLIREVASRAAAGGVSVATARCYSGPGRIALGPVAEWLGSDALRAQRHSLSPEWSGEVDRLLPPEARQSTGTPSPMVDAWQRHHFFEGLARALLQPTTPMLLVIDDLQWCDAETLSWLPMFLELADGYPVQVLAGVRGAQLPDHPALAETVGGLRTAGLSAESVLEPLAVDATVALAESVLGRPIGRDATKWHEATGGVPLFVIETARSQTLQEPSASEVGHLPRVQAVLRSRLQEVSPPAREVAGLAAAFGRAFGVNLLTEASDYSENEIVDAVDELWTRRIIRDGGAGAYDFTHDLLRDAAYEQASPPMRPLLHRRIAQAIELLAGGETREVAAVLAEQYDHANAPKRAIPNYALAAEAATKVFAYRTAVRRYARALELLDDVAAGRDRDERELSLLHDMSLPLNALEGYASPNLRANLERSALLAERLGEPRLLLLTLVGLFAVRFVQGDVAESYRMGERALALSPAYPDAAGQAHFALGGAASELGRHELAIEHLAIAHELAIDQPPALLGTRPEVHARAWCAHSLWALGRDDEAVHWADWAVRRAEEVEEPYSLAVALAYAAITHQLRHDVEASHHYAERTLDICIRYQFAYYRQWGEVLAGWCKGGDDGAARIEQGLAALRTEGALVRHPYYLSLLADVRLEQGQKAQAAAVIETALDMAEENEDSWWVPELLRLKAQVVEGDQAADLRARALALAQRDGSAALVTRINDDI
ncbi:MAG: AAA family ATPase, partial [Actinomycetes bacterium]